MAGRIRIHPDDDDDEDDSTVIPYTTRVILRFAGQICHPTSELIRPVRTPSYRKEQKE